MVRATPDFFNVSSPTNSVSALVRYPAGAPPSILFVEYVLQHDVARRSWTSPSPTRAPPPKLVKKMLIRVLDFTEPEAPREISVRGEDAVEAWVTRVLCTFALDGRTHVQ